MQARHEILDDCINYYTSTLRLLTSWDYKLIRFVKLNIHPCCKVYWVLQRWKDWAGQEGDKWMYESRRRDSVVVCHGDKSRQGEKKWDEKKPRQCKNQAGVFAYRAVTSEGCTSITALSKMQELKLLWLVVGLKTLARQLWSSVKLHSSETVLPSRNTQCLKISYVCHGLLRNTHQCSVVSHVKSVID